MATWEVIVGATAYPLSDRNPFDVVSISGVGLSPVRRLTQRGPQQHGETDLGFRLDSRHLNLVLSVRTRTLAETDAARDLLAYILGPRESRTIALRVTRDDGVVRQIDCRPVGVLDFPVSVDERIGASQKVGVQLVAVEPNWYDPIALQSSFALASFSAGMAVPVAIPLLFASATGGTGSVQVEYGGTFDEFPLLTIAGPVADAYVENVTTGDIISFLGYTIAAGDVITIDLRYGHKSVFDANGTNRIDALTDDSDLATFRLVSKLEVEEGRNELFMSGLSLSAASLVTLTYFNRYISP